MTEQNASDVLIRVKEVRKLFSVTRGFFFGGPARYVHAVDEVNFDIHQGETFGLVGESGCGKTTTGSLLVRLIEPTHGQILLREPSLHGFVLHENDAPLGALAVRLSEAGQAPPSVAASAVAPQVNPDHFKRRAISLVTHLGQGDQRLNGSSLALELDGARCALKPVRDENLTSPVANGPQAAWQSWTHQAKNIEYVDIAHFKGARLKQFRRQIQMIFQDPYGSLNPRRTIFDIVAEPLAVQKVGSVLEREAQVMEMLELVGLSPPESFMFRYPHELSGGQRQRVAIARAIIVHPAFVVADEPTSMLDVSIRTGVMKLMQNLQKELGMSYLYITHDLAVARYMCERIAVMYLGKIVELGPTEEIIQNPLHPYTKALISAVPVPDPSYARQPIELKGSIPKPIDPPPRCRFFGRCPLASDRCASEDHPPLVDHGNGHFVACYEV